jgi:hypothetical protein
VARPVGHGTSVLLSTISAKTGRLANPASSVTIEGLQGQKPPLPEHLVERSTFVGRINMLADD